MTLRLFIVVICCAFFSTLKAQEKKRLSIIRTEIPPKIDGVLNDSIWQIAQPASGFIQFQPEMGIIETSSNRTVVRMTYDDNAIYVAAYLYDDPTKIMRQFTGRDDFGQNDFFGVILNPNNDAQNDTEFFVLPSGTQLDAVATPSNGEDFGWNAVWDSAVKIADDGWVVELKIPYRALRFSNQEVQTWGIQFHRQFRRDRSRYTWSPVDVTKGNMSLYHGELVGLTNIKPPTRLSLYPFASALLNTYEGQTDTDLNLGLDVKYGISENFTLDATLIPDFSQAGFDNLILNLGPFEQTYSEQRQFFTEGIDLFSKGNLFFSRRVGSRPSGRTTLNNNETLIEFPNSVKVLNAIKVSGRTKNGLGIGVFNAITEKTNAVIRDTLTGETRTQVVEPLANYSIMVFDQQFNRNSSVSLINTNVSRNGHFRDANVTGLLFDINNKTNTYNLEGNLKMSSVNRDTGTQTGLSSFFIARKTAGNYRYSIDHSYADTNYDINDLGFINRNNFNNFGVDFSYRTFEPSKNLNNYNLSSYINLKRLANPGVYTGTNFGASFNARTKSLHNFGANFNVEPGKQFDYFEAREEGRYFIYENRINSRLYFSSNYNNTFAFDADIGGVLFFEDGRETTEYWFGFEPRVKFSERFLMVYELDYNMSINDRGYVTKRGNEIIFGQRDQRTMENSLRATYNFDANNGLGLAFRNYWSTVAYENKLYTLQTNGRLTKDTGYTADALSYNPDINFSTWNLDLSYSWQFAPGSFLTVLYRNQLFNTDDASGISYSQNLQTLFEQSIQHTFSLKMQYFIDYSNIKALFHKNTNS
ncbi:carbohydrate binding protein with CBM9 domain [Gelidibacter algens]|uniref:Carbohydrate binding protein with CBM9 domain n=1 Tax=Gelidibacter algens TaxID=49280 RepID=A0A1A7QUU8_9FLAO|nr:DUF5916 domain-containing protein [Gelidibacter algens]OBX23795.1 protein with DOMON-like ligand-binding domain protein [Gelidibacter algens]RAJ27477.1 carbohydrate binding protein with CBM9 domain [Gelidibacter algens]